MTTATVFLSGLLFAALCVAQKDPAPVFACNLKAIGPAERPRYNQLVKRLRAAVRHREAISRGLVFTLDSKAITLPEAAEWIAMERRCCPFLSLQLSASGARPDWALTISGPEGVEPFLEAEFSGR